jgi:hypothetical protein
MNEDNTKEKQKVIRCYCEVCHCPLNEVGGYDWTGMCIRCAHENAHSFHEEDERRDD